MWMKEEDITPRRKDAKGNKHILQTSSELTIDEIASIVVDTAYHLHRGLGPGLLESVYEVVLAQALTDRGHRVERQKTFTFVFNGHIFNEGLKVDLLVEGCLVVELKSVEALAPVHLKQLLTYLRLMKLPLGLLINFGAPTFKAGVKRIANNHGVTPRIPLGQDQAAE